MTSDSKVNIKWQIVFSLISPLNLWAFYRIKKLRKYLVLVWIPSILFSISLSLVGYYEMTLIDPHGGQMGADFPTLPPYMTPMKPQVTKFDLIPYNVIGVITSIGFALFSVYLIVKWSRKWNEDRK